MSSSIASTTLGRPRASAATVDESRLRVTLQDGREVSVPIEWFEFLERASEDERANFKIIGEGVGLWWDGLEDGISVPMLLGLPEDA